MQYVAFVAVLLYLVASVAINVRNLVEDRTLSSAAVTFWCFITAAVYSLLALCIHASAGLWS